MFRYQVSYQLVLYTVIELCEFKKKKKKNTDKMEVLAYSFDMCCAVKL